MALNQEPRADRFPEWRPLRGAIRRLGRRPTVRRLMIIVAACALTLGGGIWMVAMWKESRIRREMALRHTPEAAQWSRIAQLSDERRIAVQRHRILAPKRDYLQAMGYDVHRPYTYDGEIIDDADTAALARSQEEFRGEFTAICRERADYHERMLRKWNRAMWLPWTRVDPDTPRPPVEFSVGSQSY